MVAVWKIIIIIINLIILLFWSFFCYFGLTLTACYWTNCGGGSCNKLSNFTYSCEGAKDYYNILNVTSLPCFRDCKCPCLQVAKENYITIGGYKILALSERLDPDDPVFAFCVLLFFFSSRVSILGDKYTVYATVHALLNRDFWHLCAH